ncbi:MAG: FAD:protein FMN transferase [Pseudomonadota bacterium]
MRPLFAAACLLLAGCQTITPRETLLQGETMGSAWTVKIAGELPASAAQLQAGAQARFEAVNQALSTYRPASALSQFNAIESGEWVQIDAELGAVLAYALTLAQRSDGAYDVTVGSLVNLWGFGPDPAKNSVPDAAAIAAARSRVGWRKVEVDATLSRARKAPGVRVDLSSLGKGRGVDRVAEYLDSAGVSNYLIDLSGKLRAHGRNAASQPWRVAVEQPGADNAASGLPASIPLRDASVATAGDYRRYFEVAGRHYSHIVDPRTGYPVNHATASATAIGATCMEADALATVFMVMPPDAALRLADEMHIAALLIGGVESNELTPSAAWHP